VTTDAWTGIAFYILAALLIVSGLAVVLLPRIVHAALSLVFFFAMIAGIYILLQAEFIAATQIIVYVGAITVLLLFAIMLTHHSYDSNSNPTNSQWIGAAVVAGLTVVTLFIVLGQAIFPASTSATPGGVADVTKALGGLLMGNFLLPFEIAGLLLLAAMIGAIVIARET
jgi:NADH:ubiquinone oxidoreductase subunit 6 (subunit J)